MPLKTLPRDEVVRNNTIKSRWLVIDSKFYDLTDFLVAHPGGQAVLKQVAETDATEAFYNLHRQEVLQKYSSSCIGTVDGENSKGVEQRPGVLSLVPYGESTWLTPQFKSPYFKDSHRRLQNTMRVWTDTELYPVAQECEKSGKRIPQELIDNISKNGILHMRIEPGKHMHGIDLMGGAVQGEEFDYFHDLIVTQEMIPWKNRVDEEVFSGRKKICLAITEAFAGSDVAGIRTIAEKTNDGKHYIVYGT
ncbi:acyl-CoA dehydrogenase-like protein [Diplocarpon rosae]|nr:acyl-CoA dehydrogenase-like protein [Diplocarpon rosae]